MYIVIATCDQALLPSAVAFDVLSRFYFGLPLLLLS